jgi:hypothetical protein
MSAFLPAQGLPVVVRAQGITTAERYLQRLCDLLVVFGDDVLIFSDKSCAFPDTGDPRLDWSRWFRRAVMESAKQSWGAERWLREYPNRVFLDRACAQSFPLDLPPADRMRVHHVVVAHNVAVRCKAYFGGGSGSLIFNSDLNGKDHYGNPKRCRPFEVGWLDAGQNFVHVLDDTSLGILLTERDTITDFVDYLRAKEDLLHSFRHRGIRFCHTGEEELLANYLLTLTDNRHGFKFPDGYNAIFIPEGDWAEFLRCPERAAQVEADYISYSWDDLTEKFNFHILGGTSQFTTNPKISDREKLLRFFARECRVRRRLLAGALIEFIQKTGRTQRGTCVILPSSPGDPYYCFLLLPQLPGQSDDSYRKVRRELLEVLCHVTKVVYPDALDIVGLATETGIDAEPRTEDALYLDARMWNEEAESRARAAQKEFGLLTKLTKFQDKVAEFPIPRAEDVASPGKTCVTRRVRAGAARSTRSAMLDSTVCQEEQTA